MDCDFNAVRFPSEQLGAENFTQGMQDFSDFISIHGLMDIPLEDGRYTWSNSMSGSRIERSLFAEVGRFLSQYFFFFKNGWSYRTTFQFCWGVKKFKRDKALFVLKKCGFKWMVLWGR